MELQRLQNTCETHALTFYMCFYVFVAWWAGGSNAGHTVYVNGEKYKTHLIPSGVFHGVKSVVGPGCVLHPESFMEEVEYLDGNGFDVRRSIRFSYSCRISLFFY